MASISSYCRIEFNWKANPVCTETSSTEGNVIKYTFIDAESSDYENNSYQNRMNSDEIKSFHFVKQEGDECFTAKVECNNPDFAQINGISIHSESRTLEMGNETDGYIKTVRGKRLISDTEKTDEVLYICSCTFEKPLTSLSIKFLSLRSKESICVRSVSINIQQHNLNHKPSQIGNTFNMAKLKKDIEEMGDSVSDKAKDFLATMETFEKHKVGNLGNPITNALMMSMQSPVNGSGNSPGISSIMRTVLGDERMNHLEESALQNGGMKTENENIYNMLQAVCGRVAETRKAKTVENETPSMDSGNGTQDSEISVTNENLLSENFVLGILNQKLEEAKQEMTSEVHKVKEEVMNKMEDVRREMDGKLNDILMLLQNLHVQTQTLNCRQDEG